MILPFQKSQYNLDDEWLELDRLTQVWIMEPHDQFICIVRFVTVTNRHSCTKGR